MQESRQARVRRRNRKRLKASNEVIWNNTNKGTLVDLDTAHNAAAWLLLRRVVSGLGLRFWVRAQHVLAKVLIIELLMLVLLMVDVVFPEAIATLNDGLLLTVAYLSIALLLLLLIAISYGAKDNRQFIHQAAMLNDEQTKLKQLRALIRATSGGTSPAVAIYDDAIAMLESLRKAVELDSQLQPVRILGLKASAAIVRSVFVTILPIASFLLRYFFS